MTSVNARIDTTRLGYEDHGIFTGEIFLSWGLRAQAFGGYALHREAGAAFVQAVLDTVGVDAWEKLPGKFVRIIADERVHAIGHITDDRWFFPERKPWQSGPERT